MSIWSPRPKAVSRCPLPSKRLYVGDVLGTCRGRFVGKQGRKSDEEHRNAAIQARLARIPGFRPCYARDRVMM
jgi:hypothetical protein